MIEQLGRHEVVVHGSDLMFEAARRIDYDALERNTRSVQKDAGRAKLIAVVKADAYGHGALSVSRRLLEMGVDWFAVARIEEVRQLRDAELDGRILLLENTLPEAVPLLLELNATPVLSSMGQVAAWANATRDRALPGAVHLKVNTGLNRLGIEIAELLSATKTIEQAPGLWLEGIATHFSESEDIDGETTAEQQAAFSGALAKLPTNVRDSVMVHAANSCATRYWPNTHFDAVRCGGALYGLDLVADTSAVEKPSAPLAPVMSVAAPVVQVRSIRAGDSVGYGGIWQASADTTLAVIPVGYADGYPSHLQQLGRSAHVLIAGHRCPLVGRVSMDRITVDATHIADRIQEGDEALLLGEQKGQSITAAQLAGWGESSLYEVTTRFSQRLPIASQLLPAPPG